LSVAFTKEDSAETASETLLPDRPISPYPNLVTEAGFKALEFQLERAREAYESAQKIEDVNERLRKAATPSRDVRYFAARVRTAQVITNSTSTDTVVFGSAVTFSATMGACRNIVSWERTNRTLRPAPFPLCPLWQGP
jgi:transcription elongation GreA/GreB family factor